MTFNYGKSERTRDKEPVAATTKPVSRPDMVQNSDKGFVFELTPMKMLERFLILGSESPTYYARAEDITENNCRNAANLIKTNPKEVLDILLDVSENNRAPKVQPTIFILALYFKYASSEWKTEASRQAHRILRTFTHLATFLNYLTQFHGWGRSIRRIASNWYNMKSPQQVLYQYMKYGSREGWKHKDILHLGHVKPGTEMLGTLLNHIFGKCDDSALAEVFPAYQLDIDLRNATTAKQVISIIQKGKVQWEQVPTQFLKEGKVWDAIVPNMGANALLRSLGRMGACGVIKDLGDTTKAIIGRLTDAGALRAEKVHPFAILVAHKIYSNGHGERGDTRWPVNKTLVAALDNAFVTSMSNVQPTGKNFYIGVDTSGSMECGNIAGVPGMTPYDCAGAIAAEIVNREPWVEVRGFSSTLRDLGIRKGASLNTIYKNIRAGDVSSTNPSLLIQDAIKRKLPVDVFMMITDNEVNHGTHPFMELKKYRQMSGRNAKMIVVGLTATKFTLADPKDGGMLDLVGFDSAGPEVMRKFVAEGI